MTELTLFLSTASLVFALGLQQLNVQGHHYVLAALTSFLIGGAQIYLWRTMPSASGSEIVASQNAILLAHWISNRTLSVTCVTLTTS